MSARVNEGVLGSMRVNEGVLGSMRVNLGVLSVISWVCCDVWCDVCFM